jgi:hypothetical protein
LALVCIQYNFFELQTQIFSGIEDAYPRDKATQKKPEQMQLRKSAKSAGDKKAKA